MKNFTKKSIIHKIAIVLIVLMLFNFIAPMPSHISHADGGDGGIGGALFSPIVEFLVGVADWFISFIQQSIFGINETLVHITRGTGTFWSWFWTIAVTVVVIAACVALTIITEGGALPALAAFLTGGALTSTIIVAGFSFVTMKVITSPMLQNDLWLPVIEISPETIFSRRNSDV